MELARRKLRGAGARKEGLRNWLTIVIAMQRHCATYRRACGSVLADPIFL